MRRQAGLQLAQQELHDALEVGLREGVEHDDLVHPVEELGPELCPERAQHLPLHGLVGGVVRVGRPVNPVMSWLPTLLVMITTAFLKSTVRPCRRSAARRRGPGGGR